MNKQTPTTRESYIEQIWQTYRLVEVLADKNGCQTLRVRHKTLGRDLVVHSLPKPIAAYETLVRLQSPHLPLIYDAVTLDDGQIVWEEFLDGMTVADVMESGLYRYRGAKRVVSAVCDALSILHRRGFVHRDVKPENVMVDKNGRTTLIDFNASRKTTAGRRDTEVLGTIGYASPEQMGIASSDARADVYAVGVLLNVMLTGRHPSDQMAAGRAGRIVRRCTHVNPNDRYPSVDKLKKAL
ncbi:MAG: serine/threonine-protein kinase [Acutalibacteraceae bacterium]|jgi:serine/threonine protein kinase